MQCNSEVKKGYVFSYVWDNELVTVYGVSLPDILGRVAEQFNEILIDYPTWSPALCYMNRVIIAVIEDRMYTEVDEKLEPCNVSASAFLTMVWDFIE